MERTQLNSGAYVFHRNEAVIGFVLRALQEILGERADIAFQAAEQLRAQVNSFIRWEEPDLVCGPVVIRALWEHAPVRAEIVLDPEFFRILRAHLSAL
jgi:hypothetical protein